MVTYWNRSFQYFHQRVYGKKKRSILLAASIRQTYSSSHLTNEIKNRTSPITLLMFNDIREKYIVLFLLP